MIHRPWRGLNHLCLPLSGGFLSRFAQLLFLAMGGVTGQSYHFQRDVARTGLQSLYLSYRCTIWTIDDSIVDRLSVIRYVILGEMLITRIRD